MTSKTTYYIYLHIFPHKPNPKYYVGVTSQKPEKRWGYKGRGYHNKYNVIWKAIEKYGWDNIAHEILFETTNREEASLKEREYIKLYRSNERLFGYNVKPGGYSFEKVNHMENCKGENNHAYGKHWWNNGKVQLFCKDCPEEGFNRGTLPRPEEVTRRIALANKGRKNKPLTEEQRLNMSKAQRGENNGMYGKHHSEEAKEKIRRKAIGRVSNKKGKPLSEETKEKLRKRNSGENNYAYGKKIYHKGNLEKYFVPGTQEEGWIEGISDKRKASIESATKKKPSNIGENNPSFGKKWWTNGIEQLYQKDCPGNGWINMTLKKFNTPKKECIWTNGTEDIVSSVCPGEGWKRGKSIKGNKNPVFGCHWYNNGKQQVLAKTKPEGNEWVLGTLYNENRNNWARGKSWWTNGLECLFQENCPGEGWRKGRIKSVKTESN